MYNQSSNGYTRSLDLKRPIETDFWGKIRSTTFVNELQSVIQCLRSGSIPHLLNLTLKKYNVCISVNQKVIPFMVWYSSLNWTCFFQLNNRLMINKKTCVMKLMKTDIWRKRINWNWMYNCTMKNENECTMKVNMQWKIVWNCFYITQHHTSHVNQHHQFHSQLWMYSPRY